MTELNMIYPKVPKANYDEFPSANDFYMLLDDIARMMYDRHLDGDTWMEAKLYVDDFAREIVLDFMEDGATWVMCSMTDHLANLWKKGYDLILLYWLVPYYTTMIVDGNWDLEEFYSKVRRVEERKGFSDQSFYNVEDNIIC